MKFYTAVFFFLIAFVCNSQNLIWTGNADNNDFFDETNLENNIINAFPYPCSINLDEEINLELQLHVKSPTVSANNVISLDTGNLSITSINIVTKELSFISIKDSNMNQSLKNLF